MLWHRSVLFFGLFAAFGGAAPVNPMGDDVTESGNDTVALVSRGLHDMDDPRAVFRTDSRDFMTIKNSRGFTSKAQFKGKDGDYGLYNHVRGAANSHESRDNDGFVSTTWSIDTALYWTKKYYKGRAPIYKIAKDSNLINVADTLLQYYDLPKEKEFAAIEGIPWDQVIGWYTNAQWFSDGTFDKISFTENRDFNKAKYGGKTDGGAQYPLSGFPHGHPAWKQSPWRAYSACSMRAQKRNVLLEDDVILDKRASTKSTKPKANNAKPKAKSTKTKAGTAATKTGKASKTSHAAAATKTGKATKTGHATATKTHSGAATKTHTGTGTATPSSAGGTCGSAKTSKQYYDEYLSAYKAGKPLPAGKKAAAGKKMPVSGSTKTTGGKTTGAKTPKAKTT